MDSAHCAGPRFDERYQASVAVSSLQRPWSKPSGPQTIRRKGPCGITNFWAANHPGSQSTWIQDSGPEGWWNIPPTSKRLHKPRPWPASIHEVQQSPFVKDTTKVWESLLFHYKKAKWCASSAAKLHWWDMMAGRSWATAMSGLHSASLFGLQKSDALWDPCSSPAITTPTRKARLPRTFNQLRVHQSVHTDYASLPGKR